MTRRPKILFLSQILPYPLDCGPRIRTYFVLKHLSIRNDITLLAFVRSEDQLRHVGPLEELCEVHTVLLRPNLVREALLGIRSILTGESFMILRHFSQAMAHLVEKLLRTRSFDLIHVDQIKTAQYVADAKGIPKLIDKHNVYGQVLRDEAQEEGINPLMRLIARLEWRKMMAYEANVCLTFDHLLAVTEQDKAGLDEMIHSARPITVVPIASDPETVPIAQRQPDARNILFVGSMFYPANVEGVLWFAKEIYPQVKAQVPELQFYVVGSRPDQRVLQLAKNDPSIVVTGYVEELEPYLEQSALTIAPIRLGSGMRVKVLDALARGMPMVSTSFGCLGLEVQHNKELLIADTASDFARSVIRVIQDRALADGLAVNGRRFVEQALDWRITYQEVDRVYAELLEGAKDLA